MGVELHVRYRTDREGARIAFRDGSVVQLAPFSSFRFDTLPLRIEGRLVRVRPRNAAHAPTLRTYEVKA